MKGMLIRVDDPAARQRLAAALAQAGCPVRPVGSSLELQCGESPETDDREDELAFFLRAWQARHPEFTLEFVR